MSSLLVAEMARFKKPPYTHYKIHSFLIAEIASCKKFFVTRFENHLCYKFIRYSLQELLFAKKFSSLVTKITRGKHCLFKGERKKFLKNCVKLIRELFFSIIKLVFREKCEFYFILF